MPGKWDGKSRISNDKYRQNFDRIFKTNPIAKEVRTPKYKSRVVKPKKGKGPKQTGFKVKLTPWLPLTKTDPIAVPCDWIVTIAAPVDNLREMYKEDVGMTDNGLVKINVDTSLPSVATQKQSPPLQEKSYDDLPKTETERAEKVREEKAEILGTDINEVEEMEKAGEDINVVKIPENNG